MGEQKPLTINAADREEWFAYKCPFCEGDIMTMVDARPGDWIKCPHCDRTIKITGVAVESAAQILREILQEYCAGQTVEMWQKTINPPSADTVKALHKKLRKLECRPSNAVRIAEMLHGGKYEELAALLSAVSANGERSCSEMMEWLLSNMSNEI